MLPLSPSRAHSSNPSNPKHVRPSPLRPSPFSPLTLSTSLNHSHLQLLLFVYVGSVPLQLVRTLGFWSIPATAIAALVFYGVDRAAEELSDPFGEEREFFFALSSVFRVVSE